MCKYIWTNYKIGGVAVLKKFGIPLLLILAEGFLYTYDRNWFVGLLPLIAIGLVSYIYFLNNPMKHERSFRVRSFWNWMPLGLTYALLYMGRYNLTVSKNAFGDLMPKEMFGIVFGAGALIYGLAFVVNGPLTDRIGGKKAMLIGAGGAAIANLLMGWTTYSLLNDPNLSPGHPHLNILGIDMSLQTLFIILYGLNMYFQSFGAVAIVKVNSAWFHIRERGMFGVLISLGIYLAFDLNSLFLEITKTGEFLHTWVIFFIPAIALLIFLVIDFFIVKDHPEEAGYPALEVGDASSGEMKEVLNTLDIFKKLFSNPIILIILAIEFSSGVLRNGIMHWGIIFAKDVGVHGSDIFFQNWGLVLMVAGIAGGFFAGFVSDKLFQSRRGPSAFFLYAGMFAGMILMLFAVRFRIHGLIGFLSFFMSMCVIGVHGMLSGTASMDFGGKKAAATATGIIDGFVYLGTGFQSAVLGYIIPHFGWNFWPIFLIPFTLVGLYFTRQIWHAFPNAAKK